MTKPCNHELGERETACADGLCPLCLAAENERLRNLLKARQRRMTDERKRLIAGMIVIAVVIAWWSAASFG